MNLDRRLFFYESSYFEKPKRYFDGGNTSITFVAKATDNPKRELKPGNTYYFKANNTRGMYRGSTDEAYGSCEDVGEVFSYIIIKNLQEKCGVPVVGCARYFFAEMMDRSFRDIIFKQTGGSVDNSDRLYGCLSEGDLEKDQQILRGNHLLSLILDSDKAYSSRNNTIFNYNQAINTLVAKEPLCDHQTFVSPSCTRAMADLVMVDYFLNNTDRHCKNVNFKRVALPNGNIVIQPMSIIDNGACFSMQDTCCYKKFAELKETLAQNNGNFVKSPFETTFDFTPGVELFAREEDRQNYVETQYVKNIVMMASRNKVLYEDFKSIFYNVNIPESFDEMIYTTIYDRNFLPGLKEVATAAIDYKKMELSREIASQLGVEFDENTFRENPTFYVDSLGSYMEEHGIENELTVPIATNEEIANFEKMVNAPSEEQ